MIESSPLHVSGTQRSRQRRILFVLAIVAAVCAIAALAFMLFLRQATRFAAPGEFFSQKGSLDSVHVAAVSADSEYTAYQLTLFSDAGYRVRGYLRAPREEGTWPVLVLLGGTRTGKMAAELVTPPEPYVILGLDYPWEGETQLSAFEFVRRILDVRQAMLLTPSAVFLALDYLETRPDVDADAITLGGASFGAQLATVAGALDERVGPVILCYGGAEYALLLEGSLKFRPLWLRRLVSKAIASLIQPLEPLDYVAEIAPDPVVLINGLRDDRIPIESVMMLYEGAGQPKRMVWLDEGHISTRNEALLGRVLDAAVASLADIRRTEAEAQ